MDIGEIISDAIKYPASDWKKLIKLGVFYLLGFLIIPLFFAIGYVFRALKATIAGFDELPDFDEWGGMFVDGLKVFVVSLVYLIIPLIIIGVGVFTGLSSAGAFTPYGNVIVTDLTLLQAGLGIIIIGIIVAIIFGPLLFIAIAHMAYNDSEFRAAFRFREILDVISEIGWGKYILWYLAVIIVYSVIHFIGSLILGSIPVLGQILVPLLVTPYVTLFLSRAIGLRYAYE
ncbi:MAG: DUF4013 domain-containing protein [Methanobacteriaceae archaeon]|nr:DUF4013 domain-containing protein [Methanobacteriaceae archaeon]